MVSADKEAGSRATPAKQSATSLGVGEFIPAAGLELDSGLDNHEDTIGQISVGNQSVLSKFETLSRILNDFARRAVTP
jgi:hypothetical protein